MVDAPTSLQEAEAASNSQKYDVATSLYQEIISAPTKSSDDALLRAKESALLGLGAVCVKQGFVASEKCRLIWLTF